jgi:hypothetical protein
MNVPFGLALAATGFVAAVAVTIGAAWLVAEAVIATRNGIIRFGAWLHERRESEGHDAW